MRGPILPEAVTVKDLLTLHPDPAPDPEEQVLLDERRTAQERHLRQRLARLEPEELRQRLQVTEIQDRLGLEFRAARALRSMAWQYLDDLLSD